MMKNNGISEQKKWFIKADSGFIPSGEKILESIEKYDREGRVIFRAVNYGGEDTSDMMHYYFFYTDGDYLADLIISGKDKDTILLSYKFDAKGNVTDYISTQKSKVPSGNMVSGYHCIYDSDGRLIVITDNDREVLKYNYDTWGNISFIETGETITRFEYDSVGNVVSRIVSAPDFNENPEKAIYTYYKKDMIKTVVVESPDGSVISNRFVYDDRGLQVKVYYEAINLQGDGSYNREYIIVENEYR